MTSRAIFMSDIHGNITALQAVAQSIPECDAVFVAGDHCLDGAKPAETLDLLTSLGWTLIMGNTDRDIAASEPDGKGLRNDRIRWTRAALGPDRLERLANLPFSATHAADGIDSVLVVHANPLNMDQHMAPSVGEEELRLFLEDVPSNIVVFGHIHIPYMRPVGRHLLVDVSSVGHPKDLDRRPTYTIMTWDGSGRSIEQVRIPYDVSEACDLLLDSGMPGAREQVDALLRASY